MQKNDGPSIPQQESIGSIGTMILWLYCPYSICVGILGRYVGHFGGPGSSRLGGV